ncbi:MAG: N-6 DNA methylase [Alphaproteobacteria bacterium]
MANKHARKARSTPRRTLFDSLPNHSQENLYCRLDSLSNEASVEKFFVDRMLDDLGYRDNQVQTKKSISELTVSLGGSKSVKYKPDYVMTFRRKPKWILDAKATDELLNKWVPQCSGYCLTLNQSFKNQNPVDFFVLCNGIETKVYHWDDRDPILELAFSDFDIGNPKYEQLRAMLGASALADPRPVGSNTFVFERPTPQEMKALFAACHRAIWKSEGSSPTAAFMEFTKLMFVKLWCDRKLRDDPQTRELLEKGSKIKLPKSAVTFALHWISQEEKNTHNPVNDILFKTLRQGIEKDIADKKKKRIFERDENIDLRPDTIRAVVKRLEHYDMFGIDEDLNGRLFEAFLNATMRGKELGQYFTPRSIVKLMTRLAKPKVSQQHVDKMIDACCGNYHLDKTRPAHYIDFHKQRAAP